MSEKFDMNKFDLTNQDNLMNKTILLMGNSGTGKTVIIRDMMNTLKDHIP